MIDVTTETILSLKEAAREVPTLDGKKPHLSTVWRWMTDGAQGRKLESVRIGRRICTSREALIRFMQADTPKTPQPRTKQPRQHSGAVEAARARLAASGVHIEGPGAA